MSLESPRSSRLRTPEHQEGSPLRALAAQEEKALHTVSPDRRRGVAAFMALSTVLAGEMLAPVAAHAQESGRQEQSAEYGTENTGLEKTVRELQPPSVTRIAGEKIFEQRREMIGTAELLPIAPTPVAHWPTQNIVIASSVGLYASHKGDGQRHAVEKNALTLHQQIFTTRPDIRVEKTGRSTLITGIGMTRDEAIAQALCEAAEYFGVQSYSESQFDSSLSNVSQKTSEYSAIEQVDRLTARGIIASYTLDQPPHQEGKYWSVTITANEGRIKQ